MVTFDAGTAVTSADAWADREEWRTVQTLDETEFTVIDELVVFSAHPDDETLGVGGLLARMAGRGIPIRIVLATGDADRVGELRSALLHLGVSAEPELLGLTDGGLKNEADRLRESVEHVLSACGERSLVLAPWPGDRHGDHRTLGREVRQALRTTTVLFYPVWLWQWGAPVDVPWSRLIDVSLSTAERESKGAALGCFVSQLESPSNPGGVLTPDFARHAVTAPEVLIRPQAFAAVAHFEELHRRSADPWSVRTRWYERRKRDVTIAALPHERYERALELGCSIGETSAALAPRCDHLVAVDSAPAAVDAASQRLAALDQVTVERMRIPADWPDGTFDLIVISEVGYYLAADQWERTIERCRETLRPGGTVLLCHWLGHADDFAQSGAAVHEAFRRLSGLTAIVRHREREFILEVFE